jgi:phosphodiesterase/alkaline phosphatase D-like protein
LLRKVKPEEGFVVRRSLALVGAVVVLPLLPAQAGAAAFTLGVSSSEVTASSALLWTRAPKAGKLQVEVSVDKRFKKKRVTKTLSAKTADDLTAQSRIAGLTANKRYFYFFHQGAKRSVIGTFKTAPKPTVAQTIRFAVTGDAEGHKDASGKMYWNQFGARDMGVYKRMVAEKNDFNVNLGDTIYSDPTGALRDRYPKALTVAQKRATYRENLGYKNLQAFRQSGAVYNIWDDHEFINDFTPKSEACDVGALGSGGPYACDTTSIFKAGVQAFRNYMPVTYSPANGIYRSMRWGKNVEVFLLDERSFRSMRASEVKLDPSAPALTAAHACDNPAGSGTPDPAPQVPQRIRTLFGLVYPPANNPVPPECFAVLNDPSRTFLGSRQFNAFTAAVKRSTAKWKIVMNEMPIQAHYFNPWDGWQGYNAERQKLLTFLKANVKNVAFFSTDFHANWVNDARLASFPEEGGPTDTGIMDFVAGGVADNKFSNEIDDFTKSKGSYRLFEDLFFKKPSPDGPGMQCVSTNVYGYAQVEATATQLTVTLKDIDGKTVKEEGDNPRTCGPYVIKAK